ncbi:DUF397 domain-containing protein [Streptomyces sp. PTM05]|uniref:DUF397 domain-containing protein n=1 Tax=Streptantibioticus parmotrematis TaxID=2873249 RepID=A0ABS7R198_9ACTN|nr:DUF397 domain-containing protein [Streptantibioticus parmotrematis]MBY8889211.1 DUF397 domain-containing protein [Streptantibioticus parmotrematis]
MNTHIPAPELAPEGAWYKSSYSGGSGNSCVEVADLRTTRGVVGVRDSKDPSGPALQFSPVGWSSFVALAQSGEVDFDGA